MVRAERQVVLDMLFSTFEKHQYYNIKELVDITKQPVVSSMHTNKRECSNIHETTKSTPAHLVPLDVNNSPTTWWSHRLLWPKNCTSALVRTHQHGESIQHSGFVPARGEERCVGADETLRSSSPSDYIWLRNHRLSRSQTPQYTPHHHFSPNALG